MDAAGAIARIQVAWVGRGAELSDLGCPAYGLAWLAARIAPLLADTAALQPVHAEPLTAGEVERLRALEPELHALCAELAALGVPDSLEHGDLWGDNVIVDSGRPVLIDWEDASLSHPFLSPAILSLHARLVGPPLDGPDTARAIRDAYLAPWRESGPLAAWPAARVEAAFDLARAPGAALLRGAVPGGPGPHRDELGGPRLRAVLPPAPAASRPPASPA